jgi:hypothetical protein
LKTGTNFEWANFLICNDKLAEFPIYQPVLLINRCGFAKNRHRRFLCFKCNKNAGKFKNKSDMGYSMSCAHFKYFVQQEFEA